MRRRSIITICLVLVLAILAIVWYQRPTVPHALKELSASEVTQIDMTIISTQQTVTEPEEIEEIVAVLNDMELSRRILPVQKDDVYLTMEIHRQDQDTISLMVLNAEEVRLNGTRYHTGKNYCEVFRLEDEG